VRVLLVTTGPHAANGHAALTPAEMALLLPHLPGAAFMHYNVSVDRLLTAPSIKLELLAWPQVRHARYKASRSA
jgi:hypothetical protein